MPPSPRGACTRDGSRGFARRSTKLVVERERPATGGRYMPFCISAGIVADNEILEFICVVATCGNMDVGTEFVFYHWGVQ
jgi:hypothetical protein